LFACARAWQRNADNDAGWELIRASKSPDVNVRKLAAGLLAEAIVGRTCSPSLSIRAQVPEEHHGSDRPHLSAYLAIQQFEQETGMKTPYGMEIVDNCQHCRINKDQSFCNFSTEVMRSFSKLGHHSIFPAGALLFVEGQMPRGVFVLCAGKVKLSTTSRDGKVLILRIAEAGEVLALSAVISGSACELTAETAAPCLVNFVERDPLLHFVGKHGESGLHAAQVLSKEFQSAYQDIHDLVLARSSAGKLARLLLSWTPAQSNGDEIRIRSGLTHEEMAQMIGSSRETVTRVMTELKKKQFIRLDGSTLVIRNRVALEALAS
jgi:CRP/FNR family transcriptional regulator, cyclic AMP receptor protein